MLFSVALCYYSTFEPVDCHLHRYCVYTSAANKVWLCLFVSPGLSQCLFTAASPLHTHMSKNPHYGKLIKSNVRTNNTHFIIILCDTHTVNSGWFLEMTTELRKQRLYVEWLNVKSYSKIFRFTHVCCARHSKDGEMMKRQRIRQSSERANIDRTSYTISPSWIHIE